MAGSGPVPTESPSDYSFSSSHRRRELFPSNDDDSDDLGHISPLSSEGSSLDSPLNSPHLIKCKISEPSFSKFNKSTFSDYIILENIHDPAKKDADKSVDSTEDNPFENKTSLSSDKRSYPNHESSMSPLYLSPVQAMLQSPIVLSPKKFKYKTMDTDDTPSRVSPSQSLKTPQDTLNTNSKVPRLLRKSPLEYSLITAEGVKRKMPFSPSPSTNKHPKMDQGSKVRTVLFPKTDVSSVKTDVSVPTTSFYSKSANISFGRAFTNNNVEAKKAKQKSASLYLCSRRVKNRFGQINAGVTHKIRKPKPKVVAQTQLLQAALNIMNNSPLNDYLSDTKNMHTPKQRKKTAVKQTDDYAECEMEKTISLVESRKRELSPPPDPSKKFFKFKRSNATVTVEKHMRLKVDDGKLSLVEKRNVVKRRRTEAKVNLDLADLTVPDNNEHLISPEKINDILCILGNDKENDIGMKSEIVKNSDKQISECKEQLTLRAHNSVIMSENAIHLHTASGLNCGLSAQEKSVLLSPTSQMCNMTSVLALNSPKKVKQNISKIFNKNITFNDISSTLDTEHEKLYPIFYGKNKESPKSMKTSKVMTKKLKALPKGQMLLDAGQKRFGASQCSECKFVYYMGDANDELLHLNYHNAGSVLRFYGWKDEHVVAHFVNARIIKVVPSDPKAWLKKVKDLLEVVNRDLGYYEMEVDLSDSQVYLYIKNKTITGCVVAQSKTTAFRLLSNDNTGIDLCSETSYPVKCGVSRIWVSQAHRKEGIGTSLLNSLRGNFMFGSILSKDDVAFSSPTEAGKAFAEKYFDTPNFLVYTF